MENSAEREILVVQRYLVKCHAQGIVIFSWGVLWHHNRRTYSHPPAVAEVVDSFHVLLSGWERKPNCTPASSVPSTHALQRHAMLNWAPTASRMASIAVIFKGLERWAERNQPQPVTEARIASSASPLPATRGCHLPAEMVASLQLKQLLLSLINGKKWILLNRLRYMTSPKLGVI